MNLNSVVEALRNTTKGKLQYNKTWLEEKRVKETIESCAPVPHITPHCPLSSTTLQNISALEENTEEAETSSSDASSSYGSILKENDEKNLEDKTLLQNSFIQADRMMLQMQKLELDWRNELQTQREEKRLMFEEHSGRLEQTAEAQLIDYYLNRDKVLNQAEAEILEDEQSRVIELQRKTMKKAQESQMHEKKMKQRLSELETQRLKHAEEKQRKEQEMKTRLTLALTISKETAIVLEQTSKELHTFEQKKYFSPEVWKVEDALKTTVGQIEKAVTDMTSSTPVPRISAAELKGLQDKQSSVQNLQKTIQKHFKAAKEKWKEEALLAQAASHQRPTPVIPANSPVAEVQASASAPGMKRYSDVMDVLEKTKRLTDALSTSPDQEMKKYCFDLKKAVNTTINTISRQSGAHLREKVDIMYRFFNGETVQIANEALTATRHPVAKEFCALTFAQKIIVQGEVDSNPDSAFPVAMVAVGIWAECPSVGDLLLAHLYKSCPYAVPHYPARKENVTDKDYYTSLGYRYIGGKLEQQDAFLRRQSGLFRLYGALIISSPPRGKHPHGIGRAWIWLTDVINLQPRPDITAQAIYDIILVCGNALYKAYGSQFRKLVQILCTDYLPKVKQVTPEATQGSVTRLQNHLEKCVKDGSFPLPDGVLSASYWQS